MDVLEHISPRLILFLTLYGGAAVAATICCFYLLLRKGNAIASDITPPIRLRRWAASFFAIAALGHIWWLVFYVFSGDTHSVGYVMVVMLDCVTLLTSLTGTLLAMLQDRKRPIWPIIVAEVPILIFSGLQIALPSIDFTTPNIIYALVLYVFFTIYMVVAVWQYGRWLRDNYADLERKEVLVSHTLLIVILLVFVIYEVTSDDSSFLLIRIINFVLFGFLLWRVETLPQLVVVSAAQEENLPSLPMEAQELDVPPQKPQSESPNIGQMLTEHCVDTQLFLQHDLTLAQLAAAIGINRTYLSRYFSLQGMNFNTYINDLRINHFVGLYNEAAASQQPFTIQQLAGESGYRSYSTFSLAFKQRMGQSVTAWMRAQTKSGSNPPAVQ